jgi:hypothetical protein
MSMSPEKGKELSVKDLEIGELELGEIEVSALSEEDSLGIPEMAASGCNNCCYGTTTFGCS